MSSNFWNDKPATCPKIRQPEPQPEQATRRLLPGLRSFLGAWVAELRGHAVESLAIASDRAPEPLDPITSDDHEALIEIATGRLLEDSSGGGLENGLRDILANLDVAAFCCTRRGPAWVMCEVPYEFAVRDELCSGQVELRFVKGEHAWELEHARIETQGPRVDSIESNMVH